MEEGHCVYVLRGQGRKWRVGTTTRPSKRPRESYRRNKDCLGELEGVDTFCGLDSDTAKNLEKYLVDILSSLSPQCKCNIRRG